MLRQDAVMESIPVRKESAGRCSAPLDIPTPLSAHGKCSGWISGDGAGRGAIVGGIVLAGSSFEL